MGWWGQEGSHDWSALVRTLRSLMAGPLDSSTQFTDPIGQHHGTPKAWT